MPTAQQWVDSGLVPTSGLAAWNMYEAGASGDNAIYDYSGNARHLTSAALNAPVLQPGTAPNNQVSWYFDGSTTVPLQYTGALTPKHIFLLGSHADAAFNLNRGLLTDLAGVDIFTSNSSGTNFYDAAHGGGYEYSKSGTVYAESAAAAPMSGAFALLEAKIPAGIAMDGLQIGKQKAVAGRIWKGRFAEMLVYTSTLSEADIQRVRLYFNIKFWQFKVGLPFYFPCSHIVPNAQLAGGTMVNPRYHDIPQNYDEITDSFTYADKGEDFNEVADDASRRWEYGYANVNKHQRIIFDEFNRAARRSNAFYFHDNDGFTWDTVRIESYSPNHDAHKRWMQSVSFLLKGATTSIGIAEDIDATVPALDIDAPTIPTGLTATAESDTEILLAWEASTDPSSGGDSDDVTAPTVPEGLAATAESDSSILLEWDASTDEGVGGGSPTVPGGLTLTPEFPGEVLAEWT